MLASLTSAEIAQLENSLRRCIAALETDSSKASGAAASVLPKRGNPKRWSRPAEPG
jgi:hypothetical protein